MQNMEKLGSGRRRRPPQYFDTEGGETMSLEAIQTIHGVEDAMDQARLEARAQAQKLVADAQKEGRALLERSKAEAAAKTAEVMEAAQRRGEQRRADILGDTARECRQLAADADTRMAAAANMIVRRVVES